MCSMVSFEIWSGKSLFLENNYVWNSRNNYYQPAQFFKNWKSYDRQLNKWQNFKVSIKKKKVLG